MDGFDQDWNYVNGQRKATYTNLAAGDYVFKVKATNNDGTWQNEAASLKLTILRPFYRSTIAYLACGIVAVLIFILARKSALRRQQKRNKVQLVASFAVRLCDTKQCIRSFRRLQHSNFNGIPTGELACSIDFHRRVHRFALS